MRCAQHVRRRASAICVKSCALKRTKCSVRHKTCGVRDDAGTPVVKAHNILYVLVHATCVVVRTTYGFAVHTTCLAEAGSADSSASTSGTCSSPRVHAQSIWTLPILLLRPGDPPWNQLPQKVSEGPSVIKGGSNPFVPLAAPLLPAGLCRERFG